MQKVDALAERDVALLLARDVKLVGIGELRGIAICGREQDEQPVPASKGCRRGSPARLRSGR